MNSARLNLFFISIFLLIPLASTLAQQADVRTIATQLSELEMRYQQIQTHKKQLSTSADSLAEIIRKLKVKESRSFVEERELENQLRLSQSIASRTQNIYQNEALLLHELTVFSERAFKNLNETVKILTEKLQNAKQQKEEQRAKQLARELQSATQVRARCQGYLSAPPGNLPLINIQISDSDSPKQIREKADFLLDQSDRFKNAAQQVDKKLTELADEIELRHRLGDFVDDLAAFDPATETVSGASGKISGAATLADESTKMNDAITPAISGQAIALNQPLPQISSDWPANISHLSTDELERWMKQLQQQQRNLAAKADSLARQSDTFRKTLNLKQQ